MRSLLSVIKSSLAGSLVTLLVSASVFPVTLVRAETNEECVPPAASAPGVHRPVGADAAAYTYNCDNGMWESSHYTYNPGTQQITPRYPVVYTYNPASAKWDTTVWSYHSPSGQYVSWTDSVNTPPAGAQTVGGPTPPASSSSNGTSTSPAGASAAASANGAGANASAAASASTAGSTVINGTTLAAIANALSSSARSGNAGVNQNTTGGDASTGEAVAIANIINLLQSSNNAFGDISDLVTFVSNIDGDVFGDLYLDPGQIASLRQQLKDYDLTVNNSSDNRIDNDIDIKAQSGDAQVAENTTAGNATTGSAKAVANIVNIINSAISSGKSFLGVVNINGNLNGDILLPADFIEQLLAANVPTTTIDTAQLLQNNSSSLSATNNTTNGINNNLSATASTGDANVNQNTSAGNANTGVASTNITAFNLTGSNTIGKNSILVFVNVMGNWVGMIVNAPAGTTAAQLGGGVTQHSTNSNVNLNNSTNNQINNNVNVEAESGDASVNRNTTAGNASSGNADAAINLLNIASSNMSFSDWMGILFINVFGTWHGSFGVDTEAGNKPVAAAPAPTVTNGVSLPAQVFRFAPSTPESQQGAQRASSQPADTQEEAEPAAALGSTTNTPNQLPMPQSASDEIGSRLIVPFLFIGVVGSLMLAAERIALYRRNKLATA